MLLMHQESNPKSGYIHSGQQLEFHICTPVQGIYTSFNYQEYAQHVRHILNMFWTHDGQIEFTVNGTTSGFADQKLAAFWFTDDMYVRIKLSEMSLWAWNTRESSKTPNP